MIHRDVISACLERTVTKRNNLSHRVECELSVVTRIDFSVVCTIRIESLRVNPNAKRRFRREIWVGWFSKGKISPRDVSNRGYETRRTINDKDAYWKTRWPDVGNNGRDRKQLSSNAADDECTREAAETQFVVKFRVSQKNRRIDLTNF